MTVFEAIITFHCDINICPYSSNSSGISLKTLKGKLGVGGDASSCRQFLNPDPILFTVLLDIV